MSKDYTHKTITEDWPIMCTYSLVHTHGSREGCSCSEAAVRNMLRPVTTNRQRTSFRFYFAFASITCEPLLQCFTKTRSRYLEGARSYGGARSPRTVLHIRAKLYMAKVPCMFVLHQQKDIATSLGPRSNHVHG
nr:uncharacterized protein LOC129387701 [Dermacentor andersoni]